MQARIRVPACYRRGGPLAVTDANVMVGKIQAASFPKVFGSRADESLDDAVVRRRFTELAVEIERANGARLSAEEVAEGFIDVAVGAMANAVKKISIARGYDVTRYTLQCYGGAGGQHACRVADELGIATIFVHPLAGVLSAYGMGLADQTVMLEAAIELPLDDALSAVSDRLASLSSAAERELEGQGVGATRLRIHQRVHLRYEGTDTALVIPFGTRDEIHAAFEAAYRQRFAFLMPDHALVVEAVSVEAVVEGHVPVESRERMERDVAPVTSTVPMFTNGRWWDAALVPREHTRRGQLVDGPAIIAEANATTVVEPGWRARVTDLDHLVLERVQPRDDAPRDRNQRDRRSRVARGVQQPVHEHRRADGRAAPEHGLFREHQGAARFLVRALRRGGRSRGQRAAHARPPRVDERVDQDGDRAQRRAR